MSDNPPLVTVDLILELHSGLEVLKVRQAEINRRIGSLEDHLKPVPENFGSQLWGYFWQAVIWGVGITAVVVVGGAFGVEVRW